MPDTSCTVDHGGRPCPYDGFAALAEALTDVQGGAYASWLKRTPLILAALYGWTLMPTGNPLSNFGDDENDRMPWQQDEYSESDRLRDAEIARLRKALETTSLAYDTGFQDGLGEGSEQITRLRKIEAAARTYLDDNTGAKRNALRIIAGGSE